MRSVSSFCETNKGYFVKTYQDKPILSSTTIYRRNITNFLEADSLNSFVINAIVGLDTVHGHHRFVPETIEFPLSKNKTKWPIEL